jgi:hypothetical protein
MENVIQIVDIVDVWRARRRDMFVVDRRIGEIAEALSSVVEWSEISH